MEECLFITETRAFCTSVMVVRIIVFQISRNNTRVCRQQFMNFSLYCACSFWEKWSIKNDLNNVFNFFCMSHPSQLGSYFVSLQKSGVLVWIRRYDDTKLLFHQLEKWWLHFLTYLIFHLKSTTTVNRNFGTHYKRLLFNLVCVTQKFTEFIKTYFFTFCKDIFSFINLKFSIHNKIS